MYGFSTKNFGWYHFPIISSIASAGETRKETRNVKRETENRNKQSRPMMMMKTAAGKIKKMIDKIIEEDEEVKFWHLKLRYDIHYHGINLICYHSQKNIYPSREKTKMDNILDKKEAWKKLCCRWWNGFCRWGDKLIPRKEKKKKRLAFTPRNPQETRDQARNIRALCLLLCLFKQSRKTIIKPLKDKKKNYKKVNKVLMMYCKSNNDMESQEKNNNRMKKQKKFMEK